MGNVMCSIFVPVVPHCLTPDNKDTDRLTALFNRTAI